MGCRATAGNEPVTTTLRVWLPNADIKFRDLTGRNNRPLMAFQTKEEAEFFSRTEPAVPAEVKITFRPRSKPREGWR